MTNGDVRSINDIKMLFVVGNSRSGTTMMGRILGRHPWVLTFGELHFFEQMWDPRSDSRALSSEQARRLLARLFATQRQGYYAAKDPQRYAQEADALLQNLASPAEPPELFAAFLAYESNQHKKTIPCDQTPRNVFYLQEILDLYPQAYVINMIRDPRDVLLSQKNWWRRRSLGANIPLRQSIRVWAGYHPLTISMLWRSGIQAGDRFAEHPRVFQIRLRDLVDAPEEKVSKLCAFIGLKFHSEMLQVPKVGSSHRTDQPHETGIDRQVVGQWQLGGLSQTELHICQRVVEKHMLRHGYTPSNVRSNMLGLIFQGVTWVIKSGLAFCLNVNRTRNFFEAARRRFEICKMAQPGN